MSRTQVAVAAGRAVAPRPTLWPAAVATVMATARRGWWRRPPFVPVPSADYVAFRMLTQYGDPDAVPPADDVVRYLEWSRDRR
jgi:hypothetical protein